MNILVIAAHPDDEVLGCGGTIARRAAEGHDVHVAILGEGMTSRADDPAEADREALEALHADSRTVGDLLGAEAVSQHGLPDNRFDTVPLLNVIKIIEDLIAEVRPRIVFTQHGGDLNVDHRMTYRAALTATRPTEDHPVREVYAYEVASSTEWAFQRFSPAFEPNSFIDISDTLEVKVKAMQRYKSEARPFPHPRAPKTLRAIAHRWGSTAGVEAAEAFELVRSVQ